SRLVHSWRQSLKSGPAPTQFFPGSVLGELSWCQRNLLNAHVCIHAGENFLDSAVSHRVWTNGSAGRRVRFFDERDAQLSIPPAIFLRTGRDASQNQKENGNSNYFRAGDWGERLAAIERHTD